MDAYEAVIGKKDSREYTNEPVSEQSLKKVLNSVRMAGSGKKPASWPSSCSNR